MGEEGSLETKRKDIVDEIEEISRKETKFTSLSVENLRSLTGNKIKQSTTVFSIYIILSRVISMSRF